MFRRPRLVKIDSTTISLNKPKSSRPTPMSSNYFQKMDELQSMIEKQLEKKALDLKEINSRILSKFMEFQKQNQELRQEREQIVASSDTKILKIQCEMEWTEREYISVFDNEAFQDMREQEIDAEFENVPSISEKKRVKSKPIKKAKTFDRKFVMNILNSNSKTTDKLPRLIIEQTVHCRTKPKYKNRGL